MKKEKQFWRSYFDTSPSEAPSESEFISFNQEERLEDQDMMWLTNRIKRIGRLDLKETDIGDKGVEYLSRLESIEQLNLKDTLITDACIPYLLTMQDLTYLYISEHPFKAENINKLGSLGKLEYLFFTLDEETGEEDLNDLHTRLPGCEIVILNR